MEEQKEPKGPANLTELLLLQRPGALVTNKPGEKPEWSCLRGLSTRTAVTKPKFRILSLDGGGILGLAAAKVVEQLEADLKMPANKIFDMFVGTSTGGILSVGLAAGIPAKDLVKLYEEKGSEIFKDNLIGSGYSKKGLRKNLEIELRKVGKTYMKDLKDCKCAVETCLLLEEYGDAAGMLLNNWTKMYEDIPLVDACIATASAPTYFNAHKMKLAGLDLTFVDGGVTMNNPALLAKLYAESFVQSPKDDLFMCSISTGFQAQDLDPRENYNKGFRLWDEGRWKVKGVEYCMNSNCRQASFVTAESFPFEDFYRFNPESLSDLAMDNVSEKNIEKIVAVGDAMIKGSEYPKLLQRLQEVSPQ